MLESTKTHAVEWIPKPYMDKGVKWLASRPAAALFWRPGLGKTSTVLAAFCNLVKRKFVRRMLIVAPLKVCQGVWLQEASKWAQFNHLSVGFAHGKDKTSIIQDRTYDIVLLNYDGLLWATGAGGEGRHYFDGFDIICFDELPRMKSHATRRFKFMRKCIGVFKFRWGLTGSPVANGLLDLFGQVFMLDGGQRLGVGITRYRQDYFHQVPWDQWSWYPNKDTPRLLTKKLSDLAHYIDEKDWNKMPELVNVPLMVQLDKEAYKQYKLLENEFIIKLKDGEVVAGNSAILSGKLRQCASGSVYDADRNVHVIHEAKLDALESLVEELAGDPIMVAVGFLHEVEAIRKRLGAKIPYLGGGLNSGEVAKIIKNWNLGWIPILLVHPTSVAFGLNLQGGGNNICSYTLTWSAEEYDQLIRRLYRTGQKKRVMNYNILAEKTIDLYVHDVLTNKDKVQTNFVQGLKAFYKVK